MPSKLKSKKNQETENDITEDKFKKELQEQAKKESCSRTVQEWDSVTKINAQVMTEVLQKKWEKLNKTVKYSSEKK